VLFFLMSIFNIIQKCNIEFWQNSATNTYY